MIIGIGVDIVSIERFARPLSSRFFSRVFTEYEQDYCRGKTAQTPAGLFAAKEAAVKALGTGFSGFWPKDVEIMHDARGKPFIVLHGVANGIRLVGKFHISISHNETHAIAFAILESV